MGKNSGRRSGADLMAAKFNAEISPTRRISADERSVWDAVVSAWPKNHWIRSDAEILTQYCAGCIAFERMRRKEDLAGMERAGRLCLSYATKLRITPQSRYDHKGTHVEAKRGQENQAADDRLLGGIDIWQSQQDNLN